MENKGLSDLIDAVLVLGPEVKTGDVLIMLATVLQENMELRQKLNKQGGAHFEPIATLEN